MSMTPEQMEERTRDSMLKGFHCSQAVMAAGLEKYGFEDESLLRAMAPMGGGVAASGGPCGALTGGIAMLGRLFGKPTPEARDDKRMWTATAEFYRRFEAEIAGPHGSVNCRDIAKVDWKNKEQVKDFYAGAGARECAFSTGKAARILGEVIEKYAAGAG
jgi:C_GCAxxG_C_C family probable redox protein